MKESSKIFRSKTWRKTYHRWYGSGDLDRVRDRRAGDLRGDLFGERRGEVPGGVSESDDEESHWFSSASLSSSSLPSLLMLCLFWRSLKKKKKKKKKTLTPRPTELQRNLFWTLCRTTKNVVRGKSYDGGFRLGGSGRDWKRLPTPLQASDTVIF